MTKPTYSKDAPLLQFIERLYLALMLMWLVLRLLTQDAIWWVAILNSYPFIATAPGWLLLWVLIWRRKFRQALRVAGVLGGLFIWQYGALFWPNGIGERNGRELSIMTYNVKFNNGDPDAVLAVIKSANVDVVGLQEVTLEYTNLLDTELSEQYPHRVFANPEYESDVALLSKYPVVELLPFTLSPRRMSLHAVLDVEGRPIDVLVVHLMPNQYNQLNGQTPWLRTRERFNIRRVEVTDVLIELQRNTANPALLLCDCNLTETSQLYGILDDQLTDVFRAVGWGFGRTAQLGSLPVAIQRIDYIWHTGEFEATAVRLGDAASSDHRPVVATLKMPTPSP